MTRKEILKLRPEFTFGGMRMVDWFQIKEGAGYFCIDNGLRHVDGETKSPYYYSDYADGRGGERVVLKRFNEWWSEITKINEK